MNPCKPHRRRRISSFPLAVLLLLGLHLQPCFGGGTVTVCDEPGLRTALAGGGTVTFECDGTIVLSNTLNIAANTIIDASGHSIVLSGGERIQIFSATGVSLSIRNLTLTSGHASGLGGGAIRVQNGVLTLVECRLWTNSAAGADATGNGFPTFPTGGSAGGGAIFFDGGTLNATNSEFVGNFTIGGRGGTNSSYPGAIGNGGQSQGGAIYCRKGLLSFDNCRFISNRTIGGQAADSWSFNSGTSGNASGGAVFNLGGTVVAINSMFSNNHGTTPMPGGPTGGSGGTVEGGALCNSTGTVLIAHSKFVANQVLGGSASRNLGFAGAGKGGAVFNLVGTIEITNCVFLENVAAGGHNGNPAGNGNGGAIFNSGIARVGASQFARNSVQAGQGGNNPIVSGTAQGGAIFNDYTLVLTASAMVSNSAHGAEGGLSSSTPFPGSPAFGGALYTTGTCNLTNNTLAANASRGGSRTSSPPPPQNHPSFAGGNGSGGAIFNAGGALFSMNNTLAANLAQGGSGYPDGNGYGGGAVNTNGSTALANTLIANNISGSNAFGPILDLGHNLSSDSSCVFTGTGSLNNTDPKLGPLDDYGGLTPTMPLLAASPAIDAGDGATFPSLDQRGHARPFGSAPDIGAFESSPPYIIRDRIFGATLQDEVIVRTGGVETVTTNRGQYTLSGLPANAHLVSPESPFYLFVPANRSITVGPDQLDINFQAYHWNALSLDDVTDGMLHIVYAATNGQTIRLQSSADLKQWSSVATNTVGPANFWELLIPVGIEPSRFYRTVNP